MKTKCYCIYCSKHPKFKARHSLGTPVTGFEVGNYINPNFDHQGAIVNCLVPTCGAIEHEIIDPEDYGFPVTAYGDGLSETGFYNRNGLTIHANCKAEMYED